MPTTEYLKERNQRRKMVQAYLASSTWVDHQVGCVLRGPAESPYANNTIIVLFLDHGYHLGKKPGRKECHCGSVTPGCRWFLPGRALAKDFEAVVRSDSSTCIRRYWI